MNTVESLYPSVSNCSVRSDPARPILRAPLPPRPYHAFSHRAPRRDGRCTGSPRRRQRPSRLRRSRRSTRSTVPRPDRPCRSAQPRGCGFRPPARLPGLPLAAFHVGVRNEGVCAGERVLINGGTGGVGEQPLSPATPRRSATSAPGLGSSLPHICTGTGLPLCTRQRRHCAGRGGLLR